MIKVVGFTIVAGVDPILGLYTSVAFLLLMSFIGGRPAMVSAGAGSMAVVVTFASLVMGFTIGTGDLAMISDLGDLSAKLPVFEFPAVAMSVETLQIILPYSISLAFVGLMETLLTNKVVDEMTDTKSSRNRECCAQGVGNIVCGFIGAMPGCAMIGQAIANVESGGRGRLSTFVSGSALVLLLAFGSVVLGAIPLAAFIAVMIYDFKLESIVTILTVIVVVVTNNLAFGIAAGLALYYIEMYFRKREKR